MIITYSKDYNEEVHDVPWTAQVRVRTINEETIAYNLNKALNSKKHGHNVLNEVNILKYLRFRILQRTIECQGDS